MDKFAVTKGYNDNYMHYIQFLVELFEILETAMLAIHTIDQYGACISIVEKAKLPEIQNNQNLKEHFRIILPTI